MVFFPPPTTIASFGRRAVVFVLGTLIVGLRETDGPHFAKTQHASIGLWELSRTNELVPLGLPDAASSRNAFPKFARWMLDMTEDEAFFVAFAKRHTVQSVLTWFAFAAVSHVLFSLALRALGSIARAAHRGLRRLNDHVHGSLLRKDTLTKKSERYIGPFSILPLSNGEYDVRDSVRYLQVTPPKKEKVN